MPAWSSRAFVFYLTCLLFPALGWAQESGVLLGIRYPNPPSTTALTQTGAPLSPPGYLTLLLAFRNEAISLHSLEGELLIPRNDGLWRLGSKRSVYNDWVEDFIWTTPSGENPRLQGIPAFNGEHCQGHRRQAVQFISPAYLGLEQSSNGYCEGGAHPWFYATLAVIPLENLQHQGLAIHEVLGTAGLEAMQAATQTFLDNLSGSGQQDQYLPHPDEANWGFLRREGRWRVVARMERSEQATRGKPADVVVPTPLSSSLRGTDLDGASWQQVLSRIPEATDAILAPNRDWIVVLAPGKLMVFLMEAPQLGKMIFSETLPPQASVVMARTATGSMLKSLIQKMPTTVTKTTVGGGTGQ